MFRQLFSCTFPEQKRITQDALLPYLNIWNQKHPQQAEHASLVTTQLYRASSDVGSADELDPADTEFCNAVMEYRAGISGENGSLERIKHFATAIRSSVLAVQINRWIRDFPDQYQRWKAGELVNGRTFLDDKAAADEAEQAWKHIELLFSDKRQRGAIPETSMNKIEDAYREWERSLL